MKWQFGMVIKGPIAEIVELSCHILLKFNYEWSFILKEQMLKCQTLIDDS